MVVGLYNRGMASRSEVRGRRRRRQAKKKRGDVTSSRQPMRVREAWRGGESENERERESVRPEEGACVRARVFFFLSITAASARRRGVHNQFHREEKERRGASR